MSFHYLKISNSYQKAVSIIVFLGPRIAITVSSTKYDFFEHMFFNVNLTFPLTALYRSILLKLNFNFVHETFSLSKVESWLNIVYSPIATSYFSLVKRNQSMERFFQKQKSKNGSKNISSYRN